MTILKAIEPSQDKVKVLTDAILAYVKQECQGKSEHRQKQMAASLTGFIILSLDKYNIGAEEHSDSDIVEIDLYREIKNEIMDLFWYTAAQGWQSEDNFNNLTKD